MEGTFAKVPDELWELVEPLFPIEKPNPLGGRPRVSNRTILSGVAFRLRTGCQWKAIPPQFASGSTCHRRFQLWVRLGVFEKIWTRMLKFYDDAKGIDLKWSALDSAIVKAPKGGTTLGRTPPIEPRVAPSATS
jgi:transposase